MNDTHTSTRGRGRPAGKASGPRPARAGQTLIFLILALVVMFFMVLWNVDLHKTLRVKLRSQNAGDSAALIGARWQGISLNLIGDLNLMQALAMVAGDAATQNAVSNVQARIAIHGPMIGFMAAQQAAKNNGLHQYDPFTAMIREHASLVREEYARPVGDGEMAIPEPYPGAWEDYARMLELAADDGIAAGPENARFLSDYSGDHLLLDPAFYDAVAGRNWCWFHHNAPGLLDDYTDHTWWPPLPPIEIGTMINSEILGLGLERQFTSLEQLADADVVSAVIAARGLGGGTLDAPTLARGAAWYTYGPNWGPWTAMHTDGEYPFPAAGPLRPAYDYAGADSAMRVMAVTSRLTPGAGGVTISNTIVWTAAAKTFGTIGDDEPPPTYSLVLPAFDDARLIPMDASSTPAGGFDPEWRRFIEEDLPRYVSTGDLSCQSWYCDQLRTWEDPIFRSDGSAWLGENSEQCDAGGDGGGRGGGGRIGH
jgi:hypothetical protein